MKQDGACESPWARVSDVRQPSIWLHILLTKEQSGHETVVAFVCNLSWTLLDH
jgi:hypothetical protein